MLYPQTNRFRNLLDVSGIWEMAVDKEDVGEKKKWYEHIPPDTRPIAVPGSWNDQYSDIHNYMGTVWYFQDFFVPSEWSLKLIWLRIGAATYRAKVWVNGIFVGGHEIGYLPFQFEISRLLRTGEKNIITVKVDYKLSVETIPQHGTGIGHWANKGDKFPPMSGDYFPYGGIQRPVLLYTTPRNYIEDLTIITNIKGEKGLLDCTAKISGEKADRWKVSVFSGRKKVGEKAGKTGKDDADLHLSIDKAKFWSPESPYLYKLKIETIKNNRVEDEYILPFGIRTIEIKKGKILLNGKPVFLRGFSRHEEYPLIGAGLFTPGIVKDYSLMKELGVNSFRTSHYPNTEEMMRMADRLGFLVIDECPANSLFHVSNENINMKEVITPATLENHKKSLEEMIRRDKNHPSVIMWSVANEPNIGCKEAEGYFKKIYDYVRNLDPTRFVILVSCRDESNSQVPKYFDIICVNRYYMSYNFEGSFELTAEKLSRALDNIYKKYKKPVMVTEFGAPALPGEHSEPPENWTEEFQTRHLETYLDVIESKPYVVGAHIWCFAEYKTQQHIGRVINNRKGVFTRNRQPKMAVRMLKKRWNMF